MSTTVIGAGYAGTMAANRLAGRGEPVTVITPHPWFVERIRLHAVAAGQRDHARRDLAGLLHPAVELVSGTVAHIGEDTIVLGDGAQLDYDTLVYAAGSGARRPGVWSIADADGAERLRAELCARPGEQVTVVGAGLTGVELAGALRAAGRRVRLVTSTPQVRAASRAHLGELARGGVTVEMARVDLDTERDGIVVDATGFGFPSLAADSGLPVDAQGRLLVDETLTVPGRARILGAGDAVRIDAASATHLRPACATALPMGAHAADVISARRRGDDLPRFDLGYVLQCVDLGGGHGRVQFVRPDDSERPYALTGRAGGLVKEAVCRMTIRWLDQERRRPGRFSWASSATDPAPPEIGRTEAALTDAA